MSEKSEYEKEIEANRAAEKAKIDKFIADADKEILWWALYRMSQALHSARYDDPHCQGEDKRGGLYTVVHYTADHWLPQIPGMPSFEQVSRECAADHAYHELTFWAEARGLRITGDEFI